MIRLESIGIQFVVQCRICPGVPFGLLTNPVEVLNKHFSLLVGRYVPNKFIRVRNKDTYWFDGQCRHAFGLKEAHNRWTRDHTRANWEEFVRCQVAANEIFSEAKRQFRFRNSDVLAESPHKWGFTIKSAVFGLRSSLFWS